jgi:hypothetical protein
MGKQLSTKEIPMQDHDVALEPPTQGCQRGPISERVKSVLKSACAKLKGSARRLFMAETVREFGRGGLSLAERELGWNRGTIRKGTRELAAGVVCLDAFCLRGRKSSEKRLPNLLDDIRDIVEPHTQVDASLRTSRLYIKLTACQVRRQLIEQKNYRDEDLPKRRTISTILNRLGYRLRKVKKTNP